MPLDFERPIPDGSNRITTSSEIRDEATSIAHTRTSVTPRNNNEESDYSDNFATNFTKGLRHNDYGIVSNPADYRSFVKDINSEFYDTTAIYQFESRLAKQINPDIFNCSINNNEGDSTLPADIETRHWESPRAGHSYDLEGPDAGGVGMAPAPRVDSMELAAEMAEVYGLALLRDVPFTQWPENNAKKLCSDIKKLCPEIEILGESELTPDEIAKFINNLGYYKNGNTLNDSFARNRRARRTFNGITPDITGELTVKNMFRGSTPGAHKGPYISQFMLIGTPSRAGADPNSGACAVDVEDSDGNSMFSFESGRIGFGTQIVDQRTLSHKNCIDFMTCWPSWLDVQNGANHGGAVDYEKKLRFITTPRDLATYVHFDQLYQAYFNATLILLNLGTPVAGGNVKQNIFPATNQPSQTDDQRQSFATFGAAHILTLVSEVATRCLKAVRRQKFNIHRRARPELMGGRLTLVAKKEHKQLGLAADAFDTLCSNLDKITYTQEATENLEAEQITIDLLNAISAHNKKQNSKDVAKHRRIECEDNKSDFKVDNKKNYLLPMAFPEGSPMHPAYGAGHATVAGGCVTMLKAFFEMFDDNGCELNLEDEDGNSINYIPNQDGTKLKCNPENETLTIQGELDKLAANISIGRNMAGVHYYSDYYDSIRMGERIAVGILQEQIKTYGERVRMTFTSFDGDFIEIDSNEEGGIRVNGTAGLSEIREWWQRHVNPIGV